MAFKINRIIAWILALVLLYGVFQHLDLLPDWAPKPFSKPTDRQPRDLIRGAGFRRDQNRLVTAPNS